jgi:hypothetical protein
MGNHGSTLPVTPADVKLKLLVKTTEKSRPVRKARLTLKTFGAKITSSA